MKAIKIGLLIALAVGFGWLVWATWNPVSPLLASTFVVATYVCYRTNKASKQ